MVAQLITYEKSHTKATSANTANYDTKSRSQTSVRGRDFASIDFTTRSKKTMLFERFSDDRVPNGYKIKFR